MALVTAKRNDVGILALTLDGWGAHWTSRHQVLTRLAAYYQVSWLQPAHEWRQTLVAARSRAVARTMEKAPSLVRQSELWLPRVYRPKWLADRTTAWRLGRARAELLRRGCRRIVLYVWNPMFSEDVGHVPHDLVLYHMVDEYSFADEEVRISEAEQSLIEQADEVIVHSPALMEKKGVFNPRAVVIPNGVDYSSFATPADEPPDLAAMPHPRIGYVGFIKRHIDWDLIGRLARRHPDWSWVLIGGERRHDLGDSIRTLASLPNVHFLGEKPTSALAGYAQHVDVCIMPYRTTAYTKYIYPLKLHEYLATGRPVVGTRIRSLEEFDGLISLATTDDEWSAALAAALRSEAQGPDRRAARQAVARQYDWQGIVARIVERIETGLARTAHSGG